MKYSPNKILIGILVVTAIAIASIFYLVFYPQNETPNGNQITNNQEQKDRPGVPVHISIPDINVEADIQPAGLAKDGTLAVPDGPNGVTWYEYGARPGEKGSAVITGHYGPWLSGANSVFDDLNKLETGDKIYIKDDAGKILTFQLIEKKIYERTETVPEIFIKDDASYLNIITCSGQWLQNQKTFTNRLVVFTSLVE